MAQVSNVDAELSAGELEGEHTEENKKKSLLNAVKNKAKGTVRKLKEKVKKSSGDSDDRSSSPTGDSDDELEETTLGAQHMNLEEAESVQKLSPTSEVSPQEDTEKLNGSEPREASPGESDKSLLSSFARSGSSENSPLVAVPTHYSDGPPGPVDAVMPPSVIDPIPVSEHGEESSANLGEIPEAKEEEKEAVREVVSDRGPDSEINPGLKDTFKQKDLQAIDGLPKPRGFDIGNESSVNSADLRGLLSQDMTEQLDSSQEVNSSTYGPPKQTTRELPTGNSETTILGEDKDRPHPPAKSADFSDSMFSSSALQDLEPNEPAIGEAKRAEMIGTFSRDTESGPNPYAEKHVDFDESKNVLGASAEKDVDAGQVDPEESGGATSGATAAGAIGAATAATAGLSLYDSEQPKDEPAVRDFDVGSGQDGKNAYAGNDEESDTTTGATTGSFSNDSELLKGESATKDFDVGSIQDEKPGDEDVKNTGVVAGAGVAALSHDLQPSKDESTGKDFNDEVAQDDEEIPSLGGERDRGHSLTRNVETETSRACELSRGIESEKRTSSEKAPEIESFQQPRSSLTESPRDLDPVGDAAAGDLAGLDSTEEPLGSVRESSRDFEGANVQSKDSGSVATPPTTELHDNMFSSAATSELDLTKPTSTESGLETAGGDLVRDGEAEDTTFHEASKDFTQTQEADSAHSNTPRGGHSDQLSSERTAAREKTLAADDPDNFFDALDEEQAVTPKEGDSGASKTDRHDPLHVYSKKSTTPTDENESNEVESDAGLAIPKTSDRSQDVGPESSSSSPGGITSTFKSMVGSVGSRLGL